MSRASTRPGVAAPIAFDFDGDGNVLVALADSTARFDMNGDGIADKTGWIRKGDGLLALDRNQNGKIDDIGEISFVDDKEGAKTDLEGLTAFDSNGDGVLDGSDDRFVEFRLWVDRDGDGKTDAGELLSLAQAGIVSIDLSATADDEAPVPGANVVYNRGTATLSGGAKLSYLDAGLAYRPLAEVNFLPETWGRRTDSYRIVASGGELHIRSRAPWLSIEGAGGALGAAALLGFHNSAVGMLTTILIDIDGDGLEARRRDHTGAAFDMDGDGRADDTGWMSGGDGMLVIDRNGDGRITTAAEISFLAEKDGVGSAWEGLASLDANRDGVLDAKDARFADLRVWMDRDSDGVTDAGELKTLAEVGVAEIALRTGSVDTGARIGSNLPLLMGSFTRTDGRTDAVGMVALAFAPTRPVADEPIAISNHDRANESVEQAAARLVEAMSGFGARAQSDEMRFGHNTATDRVDWIGAKGL